MSSIELSSGSADENNARSATASSSDELGSYQAERALLLRQMAEQSRLLDEAKQRADHFEVQAQALAEVSPDIILRISNEGHTLEMLGKHKQVSEHLKTLLTEVQRLPSTVLSERLVAIQGALRTGDLRTHILRLPGIEGQAEQVFEEKIFPLSDSESLAVLRDLSTAEVDVKQKISADRTSLYLGLPNTAAVSDFIQTQLALKQQVGIVMIEWQQAKTQALSAGLSSPATLLEPAMKQLGSMLQPPELIAAVGSTRYAIALSSKDNAALRSRAQTFMQVILPSAAQAAPLSVFVTAPDNGVTGPELLASAAQQLSVLENPSPVDHYGELVPSLLLVQVSNAIKMGQLITRFQPIFGLSAGGKRFDSPLAIEVLAALRQSDGTVYFPAEFFRVLEASPLLHELNNQIISLGLQQLSAWSNRLPPTTRLVFNMTLAQLAYGGLPERLLQCCDTFRIDPSRILIDLNESHLSYDMESLVYNSQSLHARGVRFVLDNFGYAPIHLEWFDTIPISVVKLSRQLVTALGSTPEIAVRMRGLIQLAKSYNVSVLACGVQTEDQAVRLWEAGVIGAQGNLWASAAEAQSTQWN